MGGNLSYALPARGLTMTGFGQGLLVARGRPRAPVGRWRLPAPRSGHPGLGVALSTNPSWDTVATTAVSRGRPTAAPTGRQPRRRSQLRRGRPRRQRDADPYAALPQSAAGPRTSRLATRLTLDSDLTLSLEGTRRARVRPGARRGAERSLALLTVPRCRPGAAASTSRRSSETG